jgi:hypothetical protein
MAKVTLQRHFRVLTKFAHVESRFFGHKRQREVVLYVPVNLCARRACSTSVAVGLMGDFSVVLFRPNFMLVSEVYPMKVHKNQWLLTLLSSPDLPCGATNQGTPHGA